MDSMTREHSETLANKRKKESGPIAYVSSKRTDVFGQVEWIVWGLLSFSWLQNNDNLKVHMCYSQIDQSSIAGDE